MKKIMKFTACILILAAITSVLSACSAADRISLVNALEKTMKIRSMESHSDMTLRFGVSGLPQEDQIIFEDMMLAFDNLRIQTHQKVNQNADKTLSNTQVDANIQIKDVTVDTTLWSFTDLTGDQPNIRQIVKLPSDFTATLPPEFSGKSYMLLDEVEMPGQTELSGEDYRKMAEAASNFEPKLYDFLKEYAMQYDPDFAFIQYKEESVVNGEPLSIYELKLNNDSLRSLIRYTLTNFAQNSKIKESLKELIKVMISMSEGTETGEDLDEAFDELRDGSTNYLKDVDKLAEAFRGVNLLGERGLSVNFAINRDGYIVNQNGVIDLVIDVAAIERALEKLDENNGWTDQDGPEAPNMVFSLSVDFNIDTFNINNNIEIVAPELTEQNSFRMSDLMAYSIPFPDMLEEEPVQEPIKLVVNGKLIDQEYAPFPIGDNLLVPLRDVYEELGAVVYWREDGTVTIIKGDTRIEYILESADFEINDQVYTLDFPVINVGDKLFVPLSSIEGSLGISASYDEFSNTVTIETE